MPVCGARIRFDLDGTFRGAAQVHDEHVSLSGEWSWNPQRRLVTLEGAPLEQLHFLAPSQLAGVLQQWQEPSDDPHGWQLRQHLLVLGRD